MDDSPGARRLSNAMLAIATVALFGACLFSCPPSFSTEHRQNDSLLKSVINILGFAGSDAERSAFPTLRGVEIRDLFFHVGAAALLLALGARLLVSNVRPRMTTDDLFDFRRHLSSPYAWWALLLFVSVISSYFSHASDVAIGGVVLRLLTFAWWLPLALLLRPADARRLSGVLVVLVALMSLLGIWYFLARAEGVGRLRYPVGNELWFAACLLPAIFAAGGGVLAGLKPRDGMAGGRRVALLIASLVIVAIAGYAFWLTKSRSGAAGAFAGLCFAVFLLGPKRSRPLILLVAILIAISGVAYVQKIRVRSTQGERAHSVRTRLNHEWPYAITLWFQKPVGGHGEGGYTMLAGQFARDEQLEDPNTIASDEHAWTAEAHNEYLQLLSDVGVAGAVGFLGALVVTLVWSVRFVDARRGDTAARTDIALVAGLSAALVAIAFEEGSSVGLRHPGLPPLFFTVWACLWAMVRGDRPAPARRGEADVDVKPMNASTVRLGGVVAALGAVALGFAGIQNWRAARAQFDSDRAMREGRFADAMALADMAGRSALDPMRKLVSREIAIDGRIFELERRLQTNQAPPSDEDMRLAQDATIECTELTNTAPRFLRLSLLRWRLALVRSQAHHLRGEQQEAFEYYQDYVTWLDQCRRDEPFILEYLVRLWWEVADAIPAERFQWLRAWLRRNYMTSDPRFAALLQSYAMGVPGSKTTVDDALNIAKADAEKSADEWTDPLAPETLRIAAAIMEAQGNAADAIKYAETAATMYDSAGGRLFFAHSASLLEQAHYRFRADPAGDAAPIFDLLVRGVELLGVTVPGGSPSEKAKTPLTLEEFGQLRLAALLAHGAEAEVKDQLRALGPDLNVPMERQLAVAYARLANQFIAPTGRMELARKWVARSEELDATLPDAKYARLRIALATADENRAFEVARQLIEMAPQRRDAYGALSQAEMESPQSGIWQRLRDAFPDYPPRPQPPTTQPTTTQPVPPATQPAIGSRSGLSNDTTAPASTGSGDAPQ